MITRRLALAAFAALPLAAVPAMAQPVQITGAGASFPNPVYQRWGEGAKAIGIELNYQSVGSGAGVNQIRNRTVDFGASDAPLSQQQLEEAKLMQFPTVMGGVVPIVNIPGVAENQLRLTGELIADIYMGKVTKWNDPRIVELNGGVNLPNLAIAPVYRADASGTSFVFTSYLSALSADWKQRVGAGTSVRWGAGAGARGNEGVAGTVRNTRGGIGYVESAYAATNKLATAQLRNKAGKFVTPTIESFQAAAANADWSTLGFAASLIDQPGAESWPIVSPTFVLVPTNPENSARVTAVFRFFDWAYTNGAAAARELEYVPLPENVQASIRNAWGQLSVNGQPLWPAR
ncbi:phosphate ABC transporter substrate-binding protein PstS [Roseomonas xinghualingensis]|uniref:phosphate ABC transporter substrate-binding protein PstS n=1 Tax=Roseomonas xinghualingensis TaxID=2986475 RepID=UPI0021F24BF8|nr:phosphate ABC transporter substrate-binding protein PstS [Roseomonas sp. SXEYE001]MCV4208933.1 phosphate ABC transporter substrate-binding protein PstS [Roseomonas sp. SXEYE001]